MQRSSQPPAALHELTTKDGVKMETIVGLYWKRLGMGMFDFGGVHCKRLRSRRGLRNYFRYLFGAHGKRLVTESERTAELLF